MQVNCEKVDDCTVGPVMAPKADVKQLPSVAYEKLFEVERDYRRYRSIVNEDAGQLADFPANVVKDRDDVFAREVLGLPL